MQNRVENDNKKVKFAKLLPNLGIIAPFAPKTAQKDPQRDVRGSS